MDVLVTGATGSLGKPTVTSLRAAGHDVRALSRRSGPGLVTGELLTGEGIAAALDGASVVVHLATSRGRKDAAIARTLLEAADQARLEHLVLISIVGIEHIPLGYYRDKVEVERLVAESGVPHTVLRATQFHDLVEQLCTVQRRLPVVLAPDIRLQPIATEDVADRLVELAASPPAGRVPDIGGPEVRPLPELARVWAAARSGPRRVVPLRLPGKVFAGYRAGHPLVPGPPYGRRTFEDHLAGR
ncbi:NAD-dependent epimerase/dehydratase family protein [Blastococcus sp. CT_GayMR20]|uniref:SDR family oxidoreductase n=1 Tax=Blastococcus sp. CT_GayMR20 TaxID=2559609 RepID=UPI001073A909|nr:NAD(P)H-binding protein [Blastococcus sp. CT_GayMR20]TFV86684.1 NAD-dependent epimerase/dehydratase family protein [Blastococcus sp. CT_GayMR20]